MCGICGFATSAPVEARRAKDMLAAMRHRGPDEGGFAYVGASDEVELVPDDPTSTLDATTRLALGNRRLRVVDLSPAGRQPMTAAEGRYWIAYNGEVYNFRELRATLESKGHSFATRTDTEVILALYAHMGPAMVRELNGMFAFAIWDRATGTLFCARDHLGIKPFYYADLPEGGIVFASETRSLLASGLVEPRLDVDGLEGYLTFGSVQEPQTLFEGVRSLPPGSTLTLRARTDGSWEPPVIEEYWDAATFARAPGDGKADLLPLLRDAVASQLVSDVPLGAFLSGGIDSSALASLAASVQRGELRTVTLAFDDPALDESKRAEAIARSVGASHTTVAISADEALRSLSAALDDIDLPTQDGINTWFVSRAARAAGLTVALAGVGGDELFAGYSTFRRTRALQRLVALGPLTRPLAPLAGLVARSPDQRRKLRALLRGDTPLGHAYFLQRAIFMPDDVRALLSARPRERSPWRERARRSVEATQGMDAVTAVSYLELRHYMLSTLMRDADAMSMAHSLEVRVPLLDHRLVAALLQTPGSKKLRAGAQKPLLVETLGDLLPSDSLREGKRTFTLPFEAWLRGPLRERVEARLSSAPPSLAGHLDGNTVVRVWESFLRGETAWSRPWALFVLYEWADRTFDKRKGSP